MMITGTGMAKMIDHKCLPGLPATAAIGTPASALAKIAVTMQPAIPANTRAMTSVGHIVIPVCIKVSPCAISLAANCLRIFRHPSAG
ncbi:MAG: hypothetical protein R3D29_09780 [Nitratireductor sp.]